MSVSVVFKLAANLENLDNGVHSKEQQALIKADSGVANPKILNEMSTFKLFYCHQNIYHECSFLKEMQGF